MIKQESGPTTKDTASAQELDGNEVRLISYLAKLGVGHADLTQVLSLVHRSPEEELSSGRNPGEATPSTVEPRVARPVVQQQAVTLYLAEEQQILRDAYQLLIAGHPTIELLETSGDMSCDSLAKAAKALDPDVVLLGVKVVQEATVEKLEAIRSVVPDAALVLLFALHDSRGLKALREFSREAMGGCAYVPKHTIDTVDQLAQVISGVAEGRIIIDPTVMDGLIRTTSAQATLIAELSSKEVEVLSGIARGYRNETIAHMLSRDVKTVERHINNIYSKLQDGDETRNARVHAALLYLKATGALPAQDAF